MIEDPDAVQIKVPRDWDRIVLGGLFTVAILGVLASVAWSTASVGQLLNRTVTKAVAYGAASLFDAGWIVCMAAEWLARYDPRKAVLPRWAGHLALLIAMAAITINGDMHGSLAAGLVGALVPALAKSMWVIAIHHNAKRLDPRTQKWVDHKAAQVAAQLALVAIRRQLARARAALPAGEMTVITTAEESTEKHHGAITAALATMPGASPDEVVAQLALIGMTVTPDTVRTVSGANPDLLRTHSGFGPGPSGTVRNLQRPGAVTITDTVRSAVGEGVTDPDQVMARVRAVHGPHASEETTFRTLRTLRKTLGPSGTAP